MKKYLLLILILLNLANPVHADYLYTHINLGWVVYTTISDMTWFGQHSNILMGDRAYGDFTNALTANPDLILTTYVSGNSTYKFGFTGQYDAIRTYADANALDAEDALLHYDEDKTWSTGTRSTTVLVTGYTAGLVPGYDSGSASQRSETRVVHKTWGVPVSATLPVANPGLRTIAAISRTSGVVTVRTSTNHGLEKGDRIAIAGVTDSTNFPNGNYFIATRVDADEFTITWAGSDASSSGGTTTYNAWSNYAINYTSTILSAYYKSMVGADSGGNKFNGNFYDAITSYITDTSMELTKTAEYKSVDPPPASQDAWLIDVITDWAVDVKSQWTTYLAGTKTAYTAINGDDLENFVTGNRLTFHQGDGPDIILIEYGINPNANILAGVTVTRSKNVWELENTYGKKMVWQGWNIATTPVGYKTWTLDSGAIWYADFPSQTVELVGPGTKKTSKVSMTSNSYYWDSDTKRLYVWLSDSSDPNASALSFYGLDQSRMFSLSWFYCFGLHANGYYFPWIGGATYSFQPNDPRLWFDAVGYNIGVPATGGLKRDNSGNWSIGTDEWSESCSTSSKAFEMWRGNGVETDDVGYALSIYHRLYARKFTNGYVVFRLRSDYLASEYAGSRPKTFTAPFAFRKLNGDGSMNPPTSSFTLAQGEGIILITNYTDYGLNRGISAGGGTFK